MFFNFAKFSCCAIALFWIYLFLFSFSSFHRSFLLVQIFSWKSFSRFFRNLNSTSLTTFWFFKTNYLKRSSPRKILKKLKNTTATSCFSNPNWSKRCQQFGKSIIIKDMIHLISQRFYGRLNLLSISKMTIFNTHDHVFVWNFKKRLIYLQELENHTECLILSLRFVRDCSEMWK